MICFLEYLLDQMCAEVSLERKAECLRFAKNIIKLHQVNCISRSELKTVICDSLDVCTNESLADTLLPSTLQCLEECVSMDYGSYLQNSDHKLISTLLKVLYECKNEEIAKNLVVTLINICKVEEQKHFG